MYAIGALALIMLSSAFFHVPELLTGFVGAILIGLAVVSSVRYKRQQAGDATNAATN
ncbi:hypothetical protein D3C81_2325300 [compost metagenome]